MIGRNSLLAIVLCSLAACSSKKINTGAPNAANEGIVYYLDSDKLYHLNEKLDHLHAMGITSILLSPHHDDSVLVVKEVLRRQMSIYPHPIEINQLESDFAFQLAVALRSFKKEFASLMADSAFHILSKKKQVVFFENQGPQPLSIDAEENMAKMKIGATLHLLLGGIAVINDREMGNPNNRPLQDSNSLFNFYRKMIRIRKENAVISTGTYENLENTSDYVFSFQRHDSHRAILVAINFSGNSQRTAISNARFNLAESKISQLNGNEYPKITEQKLLVQLPPYGIEVWKIEVSRNNELK